MNAEKTPILNVGVVNYRLPIVVDTTYVVSTLCTECSRRRRQWRSRVEIFEFVARRSLYKQVFLSAIKYGCRVWATDLKFAPAKTFSLKALRRSQRIALPCLVSELFNFKDIVNLVRARCGLETTGECDEPEVDYGQMKSRDGVVRHPTRSFQGLSPHTQLGRRWLPQVLQRRVRNPWNLLLDCRRFD